MRPQNVGIHAIETYFPKTFISQEELEQFDGVSKGKYTIGLGQKCMSFVEPYEDVNSLALTVVQNTLEKYKIDPRMIGRLEVGTETLIDKSKSTKTVLMQLFNKYGNHDIEGITTINACYGGTAALFNTLAWVESSAYDGKRLGCVVTVDVAVYKKGPARPTGGAGAICMIIGPNAPIIVEPIRSTFIDHAYDFYKPDPRSEFPTVDGHLSINTYLGAIDNNFKTLNQKYAVANLRPFSLQDVDYGCFHAPFAKMVQKAFVRLFYNDVLSGYNKEVKISEEDYLTLKNSDYNSKEVTEKLSKLSSQTWNQKVKPSLLMGENLGNIYTGSLYAGLCSLISDDNIDLRNKRILMFSYGSGLASSMFFLRVGEDYSFIKSVINLKERLSQRIKIPIQEYDQIMAEREKAFGFLPSNPKVNFERLGEGVFFLSSVDKMWRRQYERYQEQTTFVKSNQVSKNNCSSTNLIDMNKVVIIDDISFNEQKARLNDRLVQIKNQIVNKGSSSSLNKDLKAGASRKRSHSQEKNLNQKIWSGFYKKTLKERLDQIQKVEPKIDTQKFEDGGLTLQRADLMVENCIGKISLPIGLALNFKINDKYLNIPMAIEEPSVIAAASSSAKFIDENGSGFSTYSTRPIMIGQIQLLQVDPLQVQYKLDQNKEKIISYANEICQTMVNRGGGVKDLKVKILNATDKKLKSTGEYQVDEMVVVDLHINVCDAMGANIVNTIVEYTAPLIEQITGGRAGLKILSNLCTERRAVSEFEIPISKLSWKDASGEDVAKRIIEGYRFAQLDPYRASTHNKGIFNGMDAVAIATGQDWRSIESSCHTYASINNKKAGYQPLTHYEIIRSKRPNFQGELVLRGMIEVPISVGSQGGVLSANPLYHNNLQLLGFPNAQQLSEIIATVGLCQNFGALRALAVEGIQKGHMNLHARNIALAGGVPTHLVEEATRFMKSRGKINVDTAKAYLEAHDMFEQVREQNVSEIQKHTPLSTFYVELDNEFLEEPITLHVAIECLDFDKQPIHLSIEPSSNSNGNQNNKNQNTINKNIQDLLFGPKGNEWLRQIFSALEIVRFKLNKKNSENSNKNLPTSKQVYRLKLITIIINLLTSSLIQLDFECSSFVIQELIYFFKNNNKNMKNINVESLISAKKQSKIGLSEQEKVKQLALIFGLNLLSECIRIFKYNNDRAHIADEYLENHLMKELFNIIESQIQAYNLWKQVQGTTQTKNLNIEKFIENRQKRLCSTMMLLCDCVDLNPNSINPNIMNVIYRLGQVYELEITMIHDVQKWKPSLDEINLYSYWLIQNNLFSQGEAIENRKAFIQYITKILKQKKQDLQSLLDNKLKTLCEITSEVIHSYYNFDQKQLVTPKL
ncbi:hydroxymethylglutaryl-CoA synthase (macronuclear) [Tetrahymena thermophila SB210]|uniref:Hydroxymethylglutaryl-CoA synthase n=1 Tax=Tetrahymena thermophila (strain SB210) TaxID=312017 RepID=I7LZN5_TETTS|nr:hydroxymethylglutaryl-CoA synthase [Tetrahymena thermophila SB210]EAR84420.2 hydroxymethylglutaryl-CoA synthase [Tetrahymena thermophila SB210]|eukprot:XP_001032083.2 hydroxymethylglutaryl-CoA synthase [Tetrahymena thermophila SB210]